MLARDAIGDPVLEAIPASPYHRRLLRLAFLAPELQRAILTGRSRRALAQALLDSGYRCSGPSRSGFSARWSNGNWGRIVSGA